MQKRVNWNRWFRSSGTALMMGVVVLALSACQPIQPLPEAAPAKGQSETAAADTKTDSATAASSIQAAEKPASGDSGKANELVKKGRSLLKMSDLRAAESAFQDAIDADPANLDAHIGLADVYLFLPEYHQQALDSAQVAADLAPNNPEVLARLSWAQSGIHKFEEARATAEKAVELGPDSASAHAALADILYAMYEVDAAYDTAKQAVALDNEDAGAWGSLGAIEFGLENWQAAGEDYARALELEPDFFLWQIISARYELDTVGDTEAAREIAQPAIDALPKHAYVLSLLVDLAITENDWESAETACKDAIELNTPDTLYPDGYTCMVGVKLLQEDYEEAAKYQNMAEEIAWPERRDITVYRMRLFNDKDQCDEGLKLAEEWLKERSFSISAVRMVGAGYLCKEDYEKAIE